MTKMLPRQGATSDTHTVHICLILKQTGQKRLLNISKKQDGCHINKSSYCWEALLLPILTLGKHTAAGHTTWLANSNSFPGSSRATMKSFKHILIALSASTCWLNQSTRKSRTWRGLIAMLGNNNKEHRGSEWKQAVCGVWVSREAKPYLEPTGGVSLNRCLREY